MTDREAKMPDSMVFYSSFASAIKRLPPDEQLKALWSILDYGLDEKEPEEDGLFMMIFDMAKPQIDANIKRKPMVVAVDVLKKKLIIQKKNLWL